MGEVKKTYNSEGVRICNFEGCDKKHNTKGHCIMHHRRLERNGDPSIVQVHRTNHGLSKTTEYRIWNLMIQRCHNSNNPAYDKYGGRGIKVCDRWLNDFMAFYQDMGPRPKGKTLDRFPDVDGNYEKSNCRWATPIEQARNKRCHKSEMNGVSLEGRRYRAEIGVNNKSVYLGSYGTAKEAIAARKAAELKYWNIEV